ncbi:CoA-binding protein [Thalassospira sp.]|uniref:CoA-binding protein n=1 Tax=Thalassospira sp. TaxID=1912094 RepID=UPI000C572316|nr:CoA-binding protein [Thalassospira sp.]MBC08103.1 CoA-binding protein [Thalassospira sp.]|tara:strand:+ start:7863 stop:8285 length:423 start_codon:yes stop_codon:yes gene_type:complete
MAEFQNPSDPEIKSLLDTTKTIALVGASPKPERPSNRVMKFLLDHGYTVIPVNPGQAGSTIHDQTVVADLSEISVTVDMVDIFRNSEDAAGVVDDAIAIGAKSVWMQLGVINPDACAKAVANGMTAVMDRCPAIELPRLS